MVSASMDPFGVWLRQLTGAQVPPLLEMFVLYLPNYACAAVGAVLAGTLQGMGRRLAEAQDLGSYRLVELLGQGGMGEVWRAEHHLLVRSAAVKIVKPEVLGAGSAEDTRLVPAPLRARSAGHILPQLSPHDPGVRTTGSPTRAPSTT